MKYDFQYRHSKQSYDPSYGNVIVATDGGYERGYEAGYGKGEAEGYTKGQTEGYEAGHTAGYTEGEQTATAKAEAHNAEILTDCNTVLPTKGVETADSLEQVPQRIGEIKSYDEGYDVGVEQGKQDEYDRFWNEYQTSGTRVGYGKAFSGVGWTDNTFKPKYNIVCSQWDSSVFEGSRITDLKGILEERGLILDISATSTGTMMFANSAITRIPAIDCRSLTACQQFCYACTSLQELEMNNVREDLTGSNAFVSCSKLTTLRVTGTIGTSVFNLKQSSLLTNESVQSIIDCLKDLTGQTAQKVTFHSNVILRLTDEQIATMVAKNWTF